MKKLAIISPDNKIEIENLDGEGLELWECGGSYSIIDGVEVRMIDDKLMVVGEEDKILDSAKKVLKAEIDMVM
jgi:hypothetical protein